ncbi:hypothetical protein OROHE_005838 [Orobanche hederae]
MDSTGNKIYIKGSTWIESDVCPTFRTDVDEGIEAPCCCNNHNYGEAIQQMGWRVGMYVETRKQSKTVKRVVEVQGSRRKLKQTDPKIMVRALFDLALQEHGVHHTSSTPKRIFNHLAAFCVAMARSKSKVSARRKMAVFEQEFGGATVCHILDKKFLGEVQDQTPKVSIKLVPELFPEPCQTQGLVPLPREQLVKEQQTML